MPADAPERADTTPEGWGPRFAPVALSDVVGLDEVGQPVRLPRAYALHRLDVEQIIAERAGCEDAESRASKCAATLAAQPNPDPVPWWAWLLIGVGIGGAATGGTIAGVVLSR